ncbi:MAG: hypothetical protein KIT68_03025 [Phycisphaeraceae bacterium]|nr:hypothetical protein [Phycisphaeraceae bacterium]
MRASTMSGMVAVMVAGAAGAALGQPVVLNYNFNGMVHSGELGSAPNPGVANAPSGYRSISDRGLNINGAAGSFGTGPINGGTGMSYTIVSSAGVPDLVMLGDRNRFGPTYALGSGNNFDSVVDADFLGIMPSWLPNGGTSIGDSNFTGVQTTNLPSPLLMDVNSQIGVLYHVSNGGGRFDVTLTFSDASSVTYTLAGPDWFGTQIAPASLPGVASQSQLGVYNGVGNRDNPTPDGTLNVFEGVVNRSSLLSGLGFDIAGKQLVSIGFGNRQSPAGVPLATTTGVPSFAVMATTVGGAVPPPANDNCASAIAVSDGATNGSSAGATGSTISGCGVADTNDVWYVYTATHTGQTRVSLCGSGFDTTLAVYTGSCAGLTQVACNDDTCGTSSRVEFPTVQGQQYRIRIAGNNGERGVFTMLISSPPGVQAGPFINPSNGHTYYLLYPSSWTDAESDAVALGGHLVAINDAAENDFAYNTVLRFDGGAVFRRGWIGLSRDSNFQTWTNGDPVAYTNWAPGEPNNAGGIENYAEMRADTGQWNDVSNLPSGSQCGIVEIPTPPTNPLGSGSAVPANVEAGRTTQLRVTVIPAGSPPSTQISVRADLQAFGGSASQAFTDQGGNLFTYDLAVPLSQALQQYVIDFTVSDAESRSSQNTLSLTVIERSWQEQADGGGDASEFPDLAQRPVGAGELRLIRGALDNGSDADMYVIGICDVSTFSATTVGGVTFDTQLFLFNSDGTGVMHNDDSTGTASTIDNSGGLVAATGNFLLAVTAYNRDPFDAFAQLIWNNTPFTGIRAPDGPGAANPVASWTGTGSTGPYTITMTGVCYPGAGGGGCNPADVATEGSPQPFIDGPDGFITGTDFDVFVQAFFQEIRRPEPTGPYIADLTDGAGTGAPDGFITGADFDFFIVKFFAGCP